MKILIEEYGRVVIYFIVGITVLGLVATGIGVWYQNHYPSLEQESGFELIEFSSLETPILLVDNIEIERMEENQAIDFATYATSYIDGSPEEVLEVVVYGTELVDVTVQGLYQLIYVVTSSSGEVFSKEVAVLIY